MESGEERLHSCPPAPALMEAGRGLQPAEVRRSHEDGAYALNMGRQIAGGGGH